MFSEKNSIYLIAGYIVFLGGIGLYLLSLLVRRHNLRRDEERLEQIAEQLQLEQQATHPTNAQSSGTRPDTGTTAQQSAAQAAPTQN